MKKDQLHVYSSVSEKLLLTHKGKQGDVDKHTVVWTESSEFLC